METRSTLLALYDPSNIVWKSWWTSNCCAGYLRNHDVTIMCRECVSRYTLWLNKSRKTAGFTYSIVHSYNSVALLAREQRFKYLHKTSHGWVTFINVCCVQSRRIDALSSSIGGYLLSGNNQANIAKNNHITLCQWDSMYQVFTMQVV